LSPKALAARPEHVNNTRVFRTPINEGAHKAVTIYASDVFLNIPHNLKLSQFKSSFLLEIAVKWDLQAFTFEV
jgi:hypothetical protein